MQHAKPVPAPGPLRLLFPLPELPFPQNVHGSLKSPFPRGLPCLLFLKLHPYPALLASVFLCPAVFVYVKFAPFETGHILFSRFACVPLALDRAPHMVATQ